VFEALQACHDLMAKFGGHRAAGGFSFPSKHLRQVKSRLVNYANATLALEHLKPLVTVDSRASLGDLTLDLYAQADTNFTSLRY
jgi:single-stranded-DNA-specific exonuclease